MPIPEKGENLQVVLQEVLQVVAETMEGNWFNAAVHNYAFAEVVFAEILPELRRRSEVLYLDFKDIPSHYPAYKNIQLFFERCQQEGLNPRLPEHRQRFNNEFLERTGGRYLIGRYLEDRIEMLRGSSIAEEGRTLHLGIDLFSRDLEPVFTPYNGIIARTGREPGPYGYGNYLIVDHQTKRNQWYSFFGHLSHQLPSPGRAVQRGEQIAVLGDFSNNENGGWSRHLHYQLLTELPPEGETPQGYCRKEDVEKCQERFPDPRMVLGTIY